ncbi:hypothetical protein BCR43DRAFT_490325 [Syncephalastrum racemosum]|uniref:PARP-type domain-containing protein n=1 Tax=Syncephalastrum racemosum TaxID=13706 RepID=A0A1X2HFR8_SYNRA|nr:hypothetical protein BCR43DRAFT_490325 [Syncephalastrum racemosum]
MTDQPVFTTYLFKYHQGRTPVSCHGCKKTIARKAFTIGVIQRKSKKEKKNKSKPQEYWHFECWKVPKEWVERARVDAIRGYPELTDRDQQRAQILLDKGEGAVWAANDEPAEVQGDSEEPNTTQSQEETEMSSKKRSRRNSDVTTLLTGVNDTNQDKKRKIADKTDKSKAKPAQNKTETSQKADTAPTTKAKSDAKDKQETKKDTAAKNGNEKSASKPKDKKQDKKTLKPKTEGAKVQKAQKKKSDESKKPSAKAAPKPAVSFSAEEKKELEDIMSEFKKLQEE